jgi:uncharacterized RDD family membrane protein YckC
MLRTEPTFLGRTRLGNEGPPIPESPPPQVPPSSDTSPGRRPPLPRAAGTSNKFLKKDEAPRFHAAGFFRRLVGGIVDLTILGPIVLLIGWIASLGTNIHLPPARYRGIDYWLDLMLAFDPALIGFLVLFVVAFVVYAAVFQTLLSRTPGMMVVRSQVIDVYGDPLSLPRAIGRALSYFASIATLGLGFLWIGFDSERRGLHDWLSGTHVVKSN